MSDTEQIKPSMPAEIAGEKRQTPAAYAESIRVTGVVQGVGFRPTVWRLARECGLLGQVWNDAEGVLIQAWADAARIDAFVERLQQEQPPLARIESIVRTPLAEAAAVPEAFSIQASHDGDARTGVAADAATCPACLAEVMDPSDRRYRYPFTNCTHCGPRLSIIRAIPYDRANTSMDAFPMCPLCRAEYEDPADRRFHAQPNACADCGPKVWLEDAPLPALPPGPETAARRLDHAETLGIGRHRGHIGNEAMLVLARS